MENGEFEKKLINMSKPGVQDLKHGELLEQAIEKARYTSVISWWWISIPLYLTAMFLMKSYFRSGTTLFSNLHEFTSKEIYLSLLFFVLLPLLFIVANVIAIRKIYFITGKPSVQSLFVSMWFNFLMIILSTGILILYLL